ncbi:MAG: site-specific DNA-methyltransferase [Patescibacteria group bacterium]|nr:site-specific DNA-methyltransferase [Patescibacteria group bacterium]
MKNIFEQLVDLLKKDERLVSQDGVLLKNQVQELARKNDPALIKLLLSDKAIKQHFFFEVEKTLIFDKEKFIRFVSNKQFLPDSYTAFKNKIGLTAGDEYVSENKEVVLTWPYKDCVLEGGMTKEDQKRDEIFYNETLAPDDINRLLDAKVFTNFKRIDKKGEHKLDGFKRDEKGTIKDNLIIKGNNLLALASLKKEFVGKVKLIYIDPPYNTGDDGFNYNDTFNHSTWMTFLKNRLEIARKMLTKDGSIFIQINDIEEAYLKVLCDEVFTRENFHTSICVQMSHLSGVKMAHKDKKLPKIKEYVLFYTNSPKIKLNPQYVPASWDEALERYSSFVVKENYTDDECEKWKIIPLNKAIKDSGVDIKDKKAVTDFKLKNADLIFRTARNRGADYSAYNPNCFNKVTNPDESYYFVYKGEDISFAADKVISINGKLTPVVALGDIWTDIGINNLSNEGGVDLRFGKKPEKLIERIIKLISNSDDDIIVDFFSGSGTTGAVAHKLKKRYILIEQLADHINKSIARIKNVIKGEQSGISKDNDWKGGGDFVYMELAKWNEEWIEKIEKAKTGKELAKLWDEMKETVFLSYKVDPTNVDANAKDFAELSIADQKKFLIECLDKNQLYVNLSEIEDREYGVSKEDIKLNKEFYEKDSF